MTGVVPINQEHLDQGKQSKLMLVQEWVGPRTSPVLAQGIG